MNETEPGIIVSIENQLVTPQVESEIKQVSTSVFRILVMAQLVRLSFRDIQQIMQGDLINIISLVTNILVIVAQIRIILLSIKAKQTALLALELETMKDLMSIRELMII